MRQLIKIWLILFPTLLVSQLAVTLFAFHYIDLRFELFGQLILIPAFQSILLHRVTRRDYGISLKSTLTVLLRRRPLAVILLILDCALLVPSWLLSYTRPGTQWALSVSAYYTGIKGLVAGVGLFVLACRDNWRRSDRLWLSLLAFGLGGYGLNYFVKWIEALTNPWFQGWTLFFHLTTLYGILFAASLLLMLKVQTVWQRRSAAAALLLDCSMALALLAAMVVILSYFNKPYLEVPWSILVSTCGVLFMSSILLAELELTRVSTKTWQETAK
ncbi:MAG TPA: hypothetical protein VGL91_17225 [Acidobacteriota bacterium]